MPTYFDRLKDFRINGEVLPLPRIIIQAFATDKSYVYKQGVTRFDILSEKYYNNPYHGYLIMLANPQFGSEEFDIPDGETIRIPFPFESALDRYNAAVKLHKTLNG